MHDLWSSCAEAGIFFDIHAWNLLRALRSRLAQARRKVLPFSPEEPCARATAHLWRKIPLALFDESAERAKVDILVAEGMRMKAIAEGFRNALATVVDMYVEQHPGCEEVIAPALEGQRAKMMLMVARKKKLLL